MNPHYFIHKRAEFKLGERGFVALEVKFKCGLDGKPLDGMWRIERELYVVDCQGLELFVGYIGQLHLDDYRLAPLQSRAAKKLDAAQPLRRLWGPA